MEPAAVRPDSEGFEVERMLKRDAFGSVALGRLALDGGDPVTAVRRDVRDGAWCLRPFAAALARRERRALQRLAGVPGVPPLLLAARGRHYRAFIPGRPLDAGGPPDAAFFVAARALLDRIHSRGVTHNDLHKEPNWIVGETGLPALVDFQLASVPRRRGAWYRLLVREDLRHLLKHQRRYCQDSLDPEAWRLLARRSWPAALWAKTVKPAYNYVTRRLLHRSDDEGRG